MSTRAYCRCNSGHYFVGEFCPLDGWSSPASRELTEAVERVTRAGLPLSIEELRKAGVGKNTLSRAIVVEFGSCECVFDAISPEGYVVNDEWKLLRELEDCFK